MFVALMINTMEPVSLHDYTFVTNTYNDCVQNGTLDRRWKLMAPHSWPPRCLEQHCLVLIGSADTPRVNLALTRK